MFYSLPFLITAIIFLIFSLFILTKTKDFKTNFIFILFALATVWWQLFQFLIQHVEGDLLYWLIKLQYVCIVFIPVLLYHFITRILNEKGVINKYIIYLGYFISSIFLILLLTTNTIIDGYNQFFWGRHSSAGDLHPFFVGYVIIFISLFIFSLAREYLRANILEKKKQYFYFLLAVMFYSASAINFIPNYGIEIYPLGFLTLWGFITFIFIAIARYHLISFSSIMNYTFVLGVVSLFSYIFWWITFTLEERIIGSVMSPEVLIFNLFIVPIYAYIFIEIYKKAKVWAYNIFENFNKSLQEREFISELGQRNNKKDSINYILEKIPLILKSDVAFIFQKDNKYKIIKGEKFNTNFTPQELERFYLQSKKVTKIEELNLEAVIPESKNSIILDLMNKHEIVLMMRLKCDDGNKIYLLLQKKNNGKYFHKEEIEFLENIKENILHKIQ